MSPEDNGTSAGAAGSGKASNTNSSTNNARSQATVRPSAVSANRNASNGPKKPPAAAATPTSASIRLPALTPSRDLAMGGRGRGANANAKKIYVPNLNAVRNKNLNVKTSRDTTRKHFHADRGARGGRGGAGRGGAGRGANLIQTTGVFSEGVGAERRPDRHREPSMRRSANASHETPGSMARPIIARDDKQPVDLKTEDTKIRLELCDSDEDDFDIALTQADLQPVKLTTEHWHVKTFGGVSETTIKLEQMDLNGTAVGTQTAEPLRQQGPTLLHISPKLPSWTTDLNDVVQSVTSKAIMLQLPDTLPFVVHDSSPERPTDADADVDDDEAGLDPYYALGRRYRKRASDSHSAASTATGATGDATASTSATGTTEPIDVDMKNVDATGLDPFASKYSHKRSKMAALTEGKVGRLLRYKSGKYRIELGCTPFDVKMGAYSGVQQDMASVSANREERSANIYNMGPLEAKIIVVPDWEALLKSDKQNSYHGG